MFLIALCCFSFNRVNPICISLQKYVGEVFNIISQQSTAKPGCVIELDAITDFVSMMDMCTNDKNVDYSIPPANLNHH